MRWREMLVWPHKTHRTPPFCWRLRSIFYHAVSQCSRWSKKGQGKQIFGVHWVHFIRNVFLEWTAFLFWIDCYVPISTHQAIKKNVKTHKTTYVHRQTIMLHVFPFFPSQYVHAYSSFKGNNDSYPPFDGGVSSIFLQFWPRTSFRSVSHPIYGMSDNPIYSHF